MRSDQLEAGDWVISWTAVASLGGNHFNLLSDYHYSE